MTPATIAKVIGMLFKLFAPTRFSFYSSQKSPTRARATATAKYQGVDNKKRESNDHYLNPEADPAQAPEGLVGTVVAGWP